jgi:hypothetical protein
MTETTKTATTIDALMEGLANWYQTKRKEDEWAGSCYESELESYTGKSCE